MKLILSFALILFLGLFFFADSSHSAVQQSELTKSITRGKALYMETCITCHQGKGEGSPPAFPPLAKSDFLLKDPVRAIGVVKFGQKGKIMVNGKEYDNMMPPPGLADDEVADVMNYILNSWGNSSKKMITVQMVKAVKEKK